MKKEHDIRIDRAKLHPWMNYKLDILLKKCAKKGIYLIITEGFRTKEYQDALYAKGRTTPGDIVTNAKGSSNSSQHMWGIAFDIAINDSKFLYDASMIKKVANIAKSIGLGWGGDWTSIIDIPHFYLKKWGSTTSKLKKEYGTPKTFIKSWEKSVSKDGGANFFTNILKTKKIGRIASGKKVKVFFTKRWYARVNYQRKVGYINQKFLK